MDENILEKIYQEKLEERIVAGISEVKHISMDEAMDIYYSSNLADKIHRGVEGIQYLDYKVLIEILQKTEPDIMKV